MATLKVVISKSRGNGKPWDNEYAVKTNGLIGQPMDLDLLLIGSGISLDATNTDPGALPTDLDQWSLIQKLLAFERRIHYAGTTITRVYVTDGRYQGPKQPGAPRTSKFWATTVSLPTTRIGLDLDQNLAPGNIVMRANWTPQGFGNYQGHRDYRGCLSDGDVKWDGNTFLGWASETAANTVKSMFDDAFFDCGLHAYLGDGYQPVEGPYAGGIVMLGIGVRRGGDSTAVGSHRDDLVDVIESIKCQPDDVINRQVGRGRKKKQS